MTPDILTRLQEIENLPTLPAVVRRLRQLMANDRSSMTEIASVISRDQATGTRVIRLVNSAFYGLRSRVTSIQQAIVLMGLNTVKNLVTGVALVRTFADGGTASLFDRERFWMHTFGCAMGARLIAVRLGKEDPEDFFLAGLLPDMWNSNGYRRRRSSRKSPLIPCAICGRWNGALVSPRAQWAGACGSPPAATWRKRDWRERNATPLLSMGGRSYSATSCTFFPQTSTVRCRLPWQPTG